MVIIVTTSGKCDNNVLLNSIPVNNSILQKQLTAGVIKEGQLLETNQGISLAVTLSPLLANMILDRLQTYMGLVTRRMVDKHPTRKKEEIWNRYFRKDGPI